MDFAISINKVPVRMTTERWYHITLGHPELSVYYYDILETIEHPDFVFIGNSEEYLAVKKLNDEMNKFIIVVYKEIDESDGFIITSFITNKKPYFAKKKMIWKQ
ncbi:MAG: hypothetical protein GXO88_08690 [Chlorobi bacterium]|nr:hypothetical protein [Chlorobiota bacterium]